MPKVSVIIPVHNAEKYLGEFGAAFSLAASQALVNSLLAMTDASAAEFDEASQTNGKGRGYAR